MNQLSLAGAQKRVVRRTCIRIATILCAVSLVAVAATPPAGFGDGRIPTPKYTEIRALYLTGIVAGMPRGERLAEEWRAQGGNAIVFNVKDADGVVSYNSGLPLANHYKRPYIQNLDAWVRWLHAHGLYVIARQDLFKDVRLVHEHPELGIRSHSTGQPWYHGRYPDPSLPAVQAYNLALAKQVAQAGVDELQLDYIRFPVLGDQKDAEFYYQHVHPNWTRADVITQFVYRVRQELRPYHVHLSLDVFGVMGWARPRDVANTGQDIVALSYYCDILCPMIYPSHFFHFDNVPNPGDRPRHFIQISMKRFQHATRNTGVVIRPWLQAFSWHTHIYSPQYIQVQVQAAREEHGDGFQFWNAGNVYRVAMRAMPAMLAKPALYWTGGYPYAISAVTSTARVSGAAPTGR
ncbi:MAG: putative glycoside hydrolase [Terriglobales bacterium]